MNLSKREIRRTALPQRTFRRETTMPRQATDLPGREVNARIQRPDMRGAEELQRLLNLAGDTAQDFLKQKRDERDAKDAGDATLDQAAGRKDEQRFAKSHAYFNAYQKEGAKALAVELSTEITEAVNERLNDDENPATIEDVDEIVESIIRSRAFGSDGKPVSFGSPEATAILGNAMREARSTVLPQALAAIKAQTDAKFLTTWAQNIVAEHDRGAEIGAVVKVEADPLAPLDGPEPAQARPRTVSLGKPTGRLPHPGAVTSNFTAHSKRGSAGIDIDGKLNDPIQAPAGGKVVAVGHDKRSGLFVKIDHGNGIVSSYSHLLTAGVKKGDTIRPGAELGRMGNSGNVKSANGGDGSHLHYRVRVNGKDVDPTSFQFSDGTALAGTIPTGEEPELASAPEAGPVRPPFDFEAAMKRLPPGIAKGEAKKFLIQVLTNRANETGDVGILAGLETSARADGTPSFTPTEIAAIQNTRDQLIEKVRIRTERAEKELHQENAEAVVMALLEGKQPSREWLLEQARVGKLDVDFAFRVAEDQENEAKALERELRMEAREAQREADYLEDEEVNSEAALLRTGYLEDFSRDRIMQRYKRGEFGTGKKAWSRFTRLLAAGREGETVLRSNPDYGTYAKRLKTNFEPKASGSLLAQARATATNWPAMWAHYETKVRTGMAPAEAYESAVRQYAPKSGDGRMLIAQRAAELKQKRLTGGQ